MNKGEKTLYLDLIENLNIEDDDDIKQVDC